MINPFRSVIHSNHFRSDWNEDWHVTPMTDKFLHRRVPSVWIKTITDVSLWFNELNESHWAYLAQMLLQSVIHDRMETLNFTAVIAEDGCTGCGSMFAEFLFGHWIWWWTHLEYVSWSSAWSMNAIANFSHNIIELECAPTVTNNWSQIIYKNINSKH